MPPKRPCKYGARTNAGKCPRKPTGGRTASAMIKHFPHYGTVEFHRTDDENERPDNILPADGPKMGLPSAAFMHSVVDHGLWQGEFHGQGRHGGGFFKAIMTQNLGQHRFEGWIRTGS